MSMKKDIFMILSDYINDLKESTYENVNVEELVRLSKKHDIGGIVYKRTSIELLKNDYYSCLYQYCVRESLLKEIQQLLKQNDIAFFLVKGPIIAETYPDSCLRTMGDVDLVIHKDDMIKAKDLLVTNGYNLNHTELQREYEIHFSKNSCVFELHHALLYKERVNDEKYVKYFSKCWEYVDKNVLDISFHYLYVIFHMRKHFMNGGLGIRFFIDLAMLSKSKDIDWNFVIGELTKLELIDFTRICNTLCERWFGIKTPFSEIDLSTEFINKATEDVLSGNTFGEIGINNSVRITNLIRKYNILRRNTSYSRRIFFYIIRTIFPSYEEISKRYKCINGKPYLLPAAWLYRIIDVLLHKPKDSLTEIKYPFIFYKDIIDREKLYNEWKV